MNLRLTHPFRKRDDAERLRTRRHAGFRRRYSRTGSRARPCRRRRRALDVRPQHIARHNAVEDVALGAFQGVLRHKFLALNFRRGVHDEREITEAHAHQAGHITIADSHSLDALEIRRGLQREDQVDDVRQSTVTLHIPADLLRTAKLARADGQTREFILGQTALQNQLGENLAGLRAGLIHGVRKGPQRERLHAILRFKVSTTITLGLVDLATKHGRAFVDLLQRLHDDRAHSEAEHEHTDQSADATGENLFATIHPPPPLLNAGSSETSSAGRAGVFTLERSMVILSDTISSTDERNS